MATLPNAVAAPSPVCLNDFALLPTSRFKLVSMLETLATRLDARATA